MWENIPRHAEMVASSGLFFNQAQFLHVNGLHHLLAVGDGGFFECLTRAQFFNHVLKDKASRFVAL